MLFFIIAINFMLTVQKLIDYLNSNIVFQMFCCILKMSKNHDIEFYSFVKFVLIPENFFKIEIKSFF